MIRINVGREVNGPEGDVPGKCRQGIFEYHAVGYPQACGYSRQPLLDACRQLKSLYGVTAKIAGLFREGYSDPVLTCAVDVGAATTVWESTTRFERFKAFTTLTEAA